jgi:hypothetical protein
VTYVPLRDEPSEGDSQYSASVDGQAPIGAKISPFFVGKKTNLMAEDPFRKATPVPTPLSNFRTAKRVLHEPRNTTQEYCNGVTSIHERKPALKHGSTINNISNLGN